LNIRDWTISRQLWWGHRIPVKGNSDVLDTWFSSALWPFVTLGWPKKTKDLKNFYPTNVLSTARDIINLWVTRMIFSGLEFMKKKPFSDVYIHPTVLTKEGKRMSKSLGTGVDPIDLIDKYGADATRFGIAWQLTGGQDLKFVEDNIVMGKKFCNKIWNATRFVLMQVGTSKLTLPKKISISDSKLDKNEKKILRSLKKITKSVDEDLDAFRVGKAAQSLYHFFWHSFCDQCIEQSKVKIKNSKQKSESERAKKVLIYVLVNSLKLLHPFLPFITEEIYQNLPIKNKKKSLMVENWPGS
jgi:valyl-tRNA synthetase